MHRCHHITKQFRLSFGMTIGIGWHAVETSRKSLKTRVAPFVRIWRNFRSSVARINSVGIYQPVNVSMHSPQYQIHIQLRI